MKQELEYLIVNYSEKDLDSINEYALTHSEAI